jgi:predicted DNA binding CopG/RHH family protein
MKKTIPSAKPPMKTLKTMTPKEIFDKPLSKFRRDRLAALAALPDESIDTIDIPEIAETTGCTRNPLYRPVTRSVTIRLNAPDIVVAQALSKRKGMPCQTFIRHLLHEALQRELTPPGA